MDRLGVRNTGRVQDCLDAAAHCEKRAASAGDLAAKNAFVAAAICWRDLAQCWRELPKEPLDRPEDPPAKEIRMANTLQTAGLPRQDARKQPTAAVTALGVVYGDIGTSTSGAHEPSTLRCSGR
jgi:hypothetical protein